MFKLATRALQMLAGKLDRAVAVASAQQHQPAPKKAHRNRTPYHRLHDEFPPRLPGRQAGAQGRSGQAGEVPLMKSCTGTKTVLAEPMTRGAHNAYRGWTLPDKEDPNEPGYLVEYVDGGKANHSAHAGYISWSPADVFERAYKEGQAAAPFEAEVRGAYCVQTQCDSYVTLLDTTKGLYCVVPSPQGHLFLRPVTVLNEKAST